MALAAELLPAELQHSILSLLLFNDDHCQLIRNSLPLEVWGSDQSVMALARAVYDFIDTYRKSPGATHVYEIAYALTVPKEVKNNLLELLSVLETNLSGINIEYTITRLEKFHRQTTLKQAIQKSLSLIERGELDKVEELLHAKLKQRLMVFDPGTTLLEAFTRKVQENREQSDKNCIFLDIPALDDRRLVPQRKRLTVIGATAKAGKSFFLVHVTKKALKQGKKVLYVTLELDKDEVSERIIQATYGLVKRKPKDKEQNRLIIKPHGFDAEQTPDLDCMYDEEVAPRIAARLESDGFINKNLFVKEYPMGYLTLSELNAFIDNLEMYHNFVPDVLVVDYGKLMYIDGREESRIAIGKNYQGLRAIATERNMAVVTATQLNRAAEGAKRADAGQVAEDYSIIATADIFLTYNQTENERALKIGRLYVAKARAEEGGFEIYITQDYASAQFALTNQEANSTWKDRYEKFMKDIFGGDDKKERKKA